VLPAETAPQRSEFRRRMGNHATRVSFYRKAPYTVAQAVESL